MMSSPPTNITRFLLPSVLPLDRGDIGRHSPTYISDLTDCILAFGVIDDDLRFKTFILLDTLQHQAQGVLWTM